MDGIFSGPAIPFSTVAAVHSGSLAEHAGGCFLGWEKGCVGFSGLEGLLVLGVRGDVTFMSRQAVGLWVGLGV